MCRINGNIDSYGAKKPLERKNLIPAIRLMEPGDRMSKAYVHWKSWQETYTGLIDQDYLDTFTLEKCKQIAERFPDNCLVAETDGRIVGFAAFGPSGTGQDAGEVFALYVLKSCQKQRIGYALMNACMDFLQQYPRVFLWVLQGNDRAIRFYQRYGFALDGATAQISLGSSRTELRMVYRRDTSPGAETA